MYKHTYTQFETNIDIDICFASLRVNDMRRKRRLLVYLNTIKFKYMYIYIYIFRVDSVEINRNLSRTTEFVLGITIPSDRSLVEIS